MKLHEITQLNDSSLSKVLQVYEGSFPVDERMKLNVWAEIFKAWYHSEGEKTYRRRLLLAIQDDSGSHTIGMAHCHIVDIAPYQRAGYLGYFAIAPEDRGGTGTEAYHLLMDWFLNSQKCDAVIFQVEKDEAGDIAVRRRNWYRRMGARQLDGVEHYLRLPGQAVVPLHVMVQSHKSISAESVLAIGQVVLIPSSPAPGHEKDSPINTIGKVNLI